MSAAFFSFTAQSIKSSFISSLLVFGISTCANASSCTVDSSDVPKWICGTSNYEGMYTAQAKSKLSKLGHGFALREASANAKSDLSKKLHKAIIDKVDVYTDETSLSMVHTRIYKAIVHEYKVLETWTDTINKEVYVLVGVPKHKLDEIIKEDATK